MSADGNWNVTINTPMGVQTLAVSITTAGDSFTGAASGQMGEQEISGKVDGDGMSGNVKLGMFGNAALSGERA